MRRTSDTRADMPSDAKLLRRLHAALGRIAVAVVVRLKRPVSIGVRVIALNGQGEVLLVRHSYRPGLSLPGGGVDAGETCRAAAARECREEAGLELTEPLAAFEVYLNRELAGRDHVVLFVTRNAAQPAPPRPGLEILSSAFYPLDALPADVTRSTLARLAEVFDRAPPSDHW